MILYLQFLAKEGTVNINNNPFEQMANRIDTMQRYFSLMSDEQREDPFVYDTLIHHGRTKATLRRLSLSMKKQCKIASSLR